MRSPLHDVHARLGGRFVDFGGWEMPVQYQSVLAEHRAVREGCGWFDVSHLGRFRWEGSGATAAIDRLLCNEINRVAAGRSQYTMALNETGGTIDDLIVWRWDEETYWVLPNAANHLRLMEIFAGDEPEVELEDLRPSTVTLAIQGPAAPSVLETVLGEAPKRFRTLTGRWKDRDFWAAGTGYTGERGGEVVIEAESGPELVEALMAAGAVPCGLGARDTLRLEAGLVLWGQELDETITPLEANLDFAVSFDHDFVGKPALERQRQHGLPRSLVAFRTEGRLIPRTGHRLQAGSSSGWVTSGNFSPGLEAGIGMGYLQPPTDEPIEVEIRRSWHSVTRVELPFVRAAP